MNYILTKKLQNKSDHVQYEELFKEQQELFNIDKENRNCILGIKSYEYDEKQNQFTIIYNCSENAKSLSKVQFNNLEEKINLYDQLLKLAEFLKKKEIIHNNIKKNNLILDNNQLYLTDFGYIQGKKQSNLFRDQLNFKLQQNPDKKRQIYPYLTTNLLEMIKMTYYNKLDEMFIQRKQEEIMENDQHVLTVMMLEIFYPFDQTKLHDIQVCIDLAEKNNRKSQIGWIKDKNPDLKDYDLFIIQEILRERFNYSNNLFSDPDSLSNKINKERLINTENKKFVKDYLENTDYEFDLVLLYYFTKQELEQTQNRVQNSQNQFDQQLKIEINRILEIYQSIDKYDMQINQQKLKMKQFKLEDQFIYLVYLDEIIENQKNKVKIENNQNQSKEKQTLRYFLLQYQLKQFYDLINNKDKEDFKFNHPIKINQRKQVCSEEENKINNQVCSDEENKINKQVCSDEENKIINQVCSDEVNKIIKQVCSDEEKKSNENLMEYINQIKFEMKLDENFQEYDYLSKDEIIIKYRNEEVKISYISNEQNNQQNKKKNKKKKDLIIVRTDIGGQIYCKHLEVIIFERDFKPNIIRMFNLITEYLIIFIENIQQQQVKLIDHKNKFQYVGDFIIDDEVDIKLTGEGTKEILNMYDDTLQIGQVYKQKGYFRNNNLNGESRTYYYHSDDRKRTFSDGSYKNGQMDGKHQHYYLKDENNSQKTKIKTTYHIPWFPKYHLQFS